MTEWKWIAYVLELPIFFLFIQPLSKRSHGKIEYCLSCMIFCLIYVGTKARLDQSQIIDLINMVFCTSLFMLYMSRIDIKTALWLAVVYTMLIEIGRILIYGPIQILGIEITIWLAFVLRIICVLLKLVLVLSLKKYLADISANRVSIFHFLNALLPVFCLVYMRISLLPNHSLSFLSLSAEQDKTFAIVVMGVLVFVTVLALVWHMSFLHRQKEIEKLEAIMNNQYEIFKQKRIADEAIMRIRHDIKNQVMVMGALSDKDEIKEMADDLMEQLNAVREVIYTDHPVLNVLINQKVAASAEKNLELKVLLNLKMEDVKFINNTDICSIFGNALDNAIEAVTKVGQTDHRSIILKGAVKAGMLLIKIENYYHHSLVEQDGVFKSTKKDKENHGYGIANIRSSVKKYGGEAYIECSQSLFTLRIVIPCK